MAQRRFWRYGLAGLAALVLLVVAGGTVFLARFDPNNLKPRIAAAVEQATGRKLALNGPIHLSWSLWPTIAMQDVALANPPGFSRPQMATLQRLDLQLAVLPLLQGRVVIARLVLVHPDIRLEQDAQGHSNWQFAPVATTAAAGSPGSAVPAPSATPSTGATAPQSPPTTTAPPPMTSKPSPPPTPPATSSSHPTP